MHVRQNPRLQTKKARVRVRREQTNAIRMLAAAQRSPLLLPTETAIPDVARVVNATAAALQVHTSRMSESQRCSWEEVFSALQAGRTVSLIMLGGSMARGQGCNDDPGGASAACAYSGRLAAWLRGQYPQARLLFENRAMGGMTTGGALVTLPITSKPITEENDDAGGGDAGAGAGAFRAGSGAVAASIILIDFAINDCAHDRTQLHSRSRAPRRPRARLCGL